MPIRPAQIEEAVAIQNVAATDGRPRVRVIAGPGTGKSSTVERRVCWLLDEHVEPEAIAVVSFTRASAFDLQARVRKACRAAGHEEAVVRVTTLHALALRALRAAGALAAYPVDPVVLDEWELRQLFDSEFGWFGHIGSITRRREVREDHEALWSTGDHVPPPGDEFPEPPISDGERRQFQAFHGPRTQLYACVLPGELVQRCVMRMDAGLMATEQRLGLEHLIVDEFQDLNPMDLRFVYGLARAGVTLFVAGDDDQSLYSFRYARPEGIQLMPDELGPVGDHLLQHCFRSTTSVLTAASTLIESFATPQRIAKRYISLYADSDPPVEGGFGCWRFREGIDEASAIARSARRLIEAGLRPREIMILLSNARGVSWQFRNALEEEGVPFELPRGTRFKDTETGRALATVLRIALRDEDYIALRTLLTIQPGVGVGTAGEIANVAIASALEYGALFREPLPAGVFAPRSSGALEHSQAVCAELVDWSGDDTVADRAGAIDHVLSLALDQAPEVAWREEVEDIPDEATLDELTEYLAAGKVDEQAEVLAAIYGRLGRVIEPEETLPDRVRVMTMHSAKGLSATVVFVPTLEEEMLPGKHRARVPGLVLEAARMLYVSITRARVACIASYAEARFINGVRTRHQPSRFLAHLGCRFTRGGALTEELARQAVEASRHL